VSSAVDLFRLPFLERPPVNHRGRYRVNKAAVDGHPRINNFIKARGGIFHGFTTAATTFRGCRDGDRKPSWRHGKGQRQLTRCVQRRGLFLVAGTTR
jgi:hypothetical protein